MDIELFHKLFRKLLKLWVPMAFITAIFILIAGSVYKYTEIDFKNNAVKASAEIIGFTEYGYPVLSYIADGTEYKLRSRSLIPNSQIGSKVDIEYHIENPVFIQIGENPIYKSSIWMIIFGAIGAAALGYIIYRRFTFI